MWQEVSGLSKTIDISFLRKEVSSFGAALLVLWGFRKQNSSKILTSYDPSAVNYGYKPNCNPKIAVEMSDEKVTLTACPELRGEETAPNLKIALSPRSDAALHLLTDEGDFSRLKNVMLRLLSTLGIVNLGLGRRKTRI